MESNVALVVGVATALGGLIGFLKAGSVPSLAAGLTFGGALVGSSIAIQRGSRGVGYLGALLVSGALAYVMGNKFLVSKKFMPAGLVASMSAFSFVFYLIKLFLARSTETMRKHAFTEEEEPLVLVEVVLLRP
ncbi:hypothetical protein PROFUN_05467 [Planoprotostelium fungivorum]|uniref:Transmembrane protein 14C n=1 Tax=Planoprotostelium fungivorum TaxID=1890364 RepID=A0A2P6NQT3_9EUKA|nr:hypothetical protein PROFUN_05467 [Planoprotostelium fungivorum]